MAGIKHPSGVRGLIIRVSDQLTCGEISLFEKDPEEAETAKAKLDAQRKKRRERYARNKDRINAPRRAAYVSKRSAYLANIRNSTEVTKFSRTISDALMKVG
jgi:hypothetical protein